VIQEQWRGLTGDPDGDPTAPEMATERRLRGAEPDGDPDGVRQKADSAARWESMVYPKAFKAQQRGDLGSLPDRNQRKLADAQQ
jgi:hypothetical protein